MLLLLPAWLSSMFTGVSDAKVNSPTYLYPEGQALKQIQALLLHSMHAATFPSSPSEAPNADISCARGGR